MPMVLAVGGHKIHIHQGQTRKRLSEIADYTSGMTCICIRCALMAYYKDAYQLLTHKRYLSVVIHHHMGGHYGAFCTNAKVWQCGFYKA
jgi:hypothetical protein